MLFESVSYHHRAAKVLVRSHSVNFIAHTDNIFPAHIEEASGESFIFNFRLPIEAFSSSKVVSGELACEGRGRRTPDAGRENTIGRS